MHKRLSVLIGVASALAVMASADEEFSQQDVNATVEAFVKARTTDGVYHFKDQVADATLDLELDRVRLVRRIEGYGYFADTDFHAKGDPAKAYDLDFWLKPAAGKLEVVDIRIHKAPKRDGDAWKLVTRNPVPWWWIPATEHPGETEEKKGWQLESAVNEYIAKQAKDGVYALKDDKTGVEHDLDFVEIHRPLRKIEGRGYFACTDFREHDSKDKFYDIDFWLVEKDGQLQVTDVRVHKEPREEDGVWVQVPRYNFDKDTVKDVH